jgi:pimeloyl-ACP methyl ester carboxylesterase
MSSTSSKTIVFVTGAFVSNACWDEWKTWFEGRGYKTIAPPWPHKDAPAAELRRRHPDPGIASIRLKQVTDNYAEIIKQLPEKPIIIGHSLGGLMTQILINRDLGVAGVAIDSVPPQGVIPYEFSFLKAGWRALGLFTSSKKSYLMSFKTWQYAFVNGMSLEDQKAAYERITIPESKLAARDGLTSAAKVDFKKPHAPLLLLGGANDHIMPASINRRNFKKYKKDGSITEFVIREGRNHFVLGLPTWKEDAEFILNWVERVTRS